MKDNIRNLIQNFKCAGIDSITFGDGKMVLLDVEFYSGESYYIAPITDSTIDSYLKYNLDDLTPFDVFSTVEHNGYEILVGDASGEGNGVIYVLNKDEKSLVWFAFFENSEPFKTVSVNDEGIISAISNLNIVWKISIANPLEIELEFPDSSKL